MADNINSLAGTWRQLAAGAKRDEYITYEQLFAAYRQTYALFKGLKTERLLPREAFRIIMLIDEFTYYATMLDENYMGEIKAGLCYLNYSLKGEFFISDYQTEFFIGAMPSEIKDRIATLENMSLDEFIAFLKGEEER